MKIAVDTNVLAYAEGVNGKARRDETLTMLERFARHEVVLPAQVLGELFAVLHRKAHRSAENAKAALLGWTDAYRVIDTTSAIVLSAADLIGDHGLSFWDAVIVSAAAQEQCRLLLSEDMHEGFTWRGTTIANPYASTPHALIQAFL